MASISDLLLEQGRRRGDAERQSGDRRAALWQGAGNAVASTVGQIAQYQQDAPRRKLEGLQVQQAEGQMATSKRDAQESTALKAAKTPDEIMGIVGPERGAKILQGLSALESARTKQFADQQAVIRDTLAGLDATPEPLRAEAYGGVRKTLLDAGIIQPQDAPEAYDPKWFASARNYGQAAPKPQEGFTLNPGDTRYGPDGKPIATAAPTPDKPAAPVYVTVKGPGGKPIRRLVSPEELKTGVEEYQKPDAPRDQRLVQVMGPGGVPIWVKEDQAVNQPAAQAPRAVTGAERQALSFYNRAKDAVDTIKPLEAEVAKLGLAGQTALQYAPNFLQTQVGQQYRQAQRAFTEARLRKESGAAIPNSEFDNDAKTYFAQPGDSPETIKQKEQKRDKLLEGLGYSAGKAYEEFYGEAMPKMGAAKPGDTANVVPDLVWDAKAAKLVPNPKKGGG